MVDRLLPRNLPALTKRILQGHLQGGRGVPEFRRSREKEEGMKICSWEKDSNRLKAAWGVALLVLMPLAGLYAKTNPPPKLLIQDTPLNREVRAPISFAPVIRKVEPSVVNIYSTMTVK
jgi:hypothetical protein